MGQAVAEPLDRAAREAHGGRVPTLHAARPPEGRTLRFEAVGLGHDAHDPLLFLERILPEPARQTRVVVLDGARHPEQGGVAAVGLDPVELAGRDSHGRVGEAGMIARECLALRFLDPLEFVHGPRRADATAELLAGARHAGRTHIAHAVHPCRTRSLEIFESGLHPEPVKDPRRADGDIRPFVGERCLEADLERLDHGIVEPRGHCERRIELAGRTAGQRGRSTRQIEGEPPRPESHEELVRIAAGAFRTFRREGGQFGHGPGARESDLLQVGIVLDESVLQVLNRLDPALQVSRTRIPGVRPEGARIGIVDGKDD